MPQDTVQSKLFHAKEAGVTLLELLTVVFILSTMTLLAIPSFTQWRQNLVYRQAARSIVRLLRETRSAAIAMNREHRVEFEPSARRFGKRTGDRPSGTNWTSAPPVTDWIPCPDDATISANIRSIQFNTNGTANGGTITVRDRNLIKKYSVVVARTGRIRMQ